MNGKTFISTNKGVHILYDKSTRRFISSDWFDYKAILGLDKPMNRVKARTAPTSVKNCRVGIQYAQNLLGQHEILRLTGHDTHIQDFVKP